jgi:hypothetical protein
MFIWWRNKNFCSGTSWPLGRLRRRWDTVKEIIREVGCEDINWTELLPKSCPVSSFDVSVRNLRVLLTRVSESSRVKFIPMILVQSSQVQSNGIVQSSWVRLLRWFRVQSVDVLADQDLFASRGKHCTHMYIYKYMWKLYTCVCERTSSQ